ncbi:alpha-tocopherol transfer protein [Musca vetustissima]|uniref:alpha-tocopherol transfer protein n=1 Tax=Musca vetustissima TaxID=27455 RepID=UPI002AB64EC5|nr:alpha-tocopherol transfer protein [Musca vetustissima]
MPNKLPPPNVDIAKTVQNENRELCEENLAALQIWLKKTPHLKVRQNPNLLLAFLRCCRFDLEETKKRLDGFYSLKAGFPEVLMQRRLDEHLMTLYRSGIHTIPLNPISPDGPRLVISQFSKYDPKIFNPKDIYKLLFMLLEIMAVEESNVSAYGIVHIVDVRDVSMEQMMQYHPSLLKKSWMLMEHCFPLRVNEIHLINMRKERRAMFNFVTSFLPKKMSLKFIVHEKAEDLYAHIPRDAMTVEYGGHNGYQFESLKHWESVMLKYQNYFATDDNYGTNEKLRISIGNSLEISLLSGLNGSFRKLNVE